MGARSRLARIHDGGPRFVFGIVEREAGAFGVVGQDRMDRGKQVAGGRRLA